MIFKQLRAIFTIVEMAITLSVVIILMYMFKSKSKQIRQRWAKMQMKLLGITIHIEGKEDSEANMQIMNHQSVLDIILFEHLHSRNLAWISKVEIANIPWFGHIAKAPEMILVERESKKSLIKLLKDCKDRLDKNRPIGIFPEGTRTDGKSMIKFKAGARIIAEKFNLKVQPVVIVGTRKILDSQNLKQESGIVKVIYLPAVVANKQTNWYKDIEESMKEILAKELPSDI
ncbi:MAG: lysophospholipid acyltransferase family protein [Campylobacterota bacterium]|nr:lysophospholipid acyltransferase family protein [Campylobacterota bacterium]